MKIVNFREFSGYPPGTIFSYFNPDVFVGLWRKEETIYEKAGERYPFSPYDNGAIDYFQSSLLPQMRTISGMNNMGLHDSEIVIGDKERWGKFDFDQQYAIYEEQDLLTLRSLL